MSDWPRLCWNFRYGMEMLGSNLSICDDIHYELWFHSSLSWLFCVLDQEYHCANEGQTCKCYGKVKFGKHQTWTAERSVNGSIGCNNGVFGDPLHSTFKECRCISTSMLILFIYKKSRSIKYALIIPIKVFSLKCCHNLVEEISSTSTVPTTTTPIKKYTTDSTGTIGTILNVNEWEYYNQLCLKWICSIFHHTLFQYLFVLVLP